jgi:nucleoside-diphosphate kinase
MTLERTLSIIKPDAVSKNLIGEIYGMFEKSGFRIIAAKMLHLTREEAEAFYDVHSTRPFFKSLISFMISGPVMIQVLEGEQAVLRYRELMGATDPKEAAPGTIRALYADNIEANVVHGSDSLDTARREIAFFFHDEELCPRI